MTNFALTKPIGISLSGGQIATTTGGLAQGSVTATLSGPSAADAGVQEQYTLQLSSPASQVYTVTWGSTGGAQLSSSTGTIGIGQTTATVLATWSSSGAGSISASLSPSVTVSGSPKTVTVAAEPPAPAPFTGTYRSYLVHPRSKKDAGQQPASGAAGPTAIFFSTHLGSRWDFENGDFIDKNGLKFNGANSASMVPWHTLLVPLADPLGYTNLDVKLLVDHWLSTGQNKGAYFFSDNTSNNSAWVDISGTNSANPPKLTVVTTTGTFDYVGDLAGWAVGSTQGDDSRYIRRMARTNRCLIQFEYLPDVTGTVISAHLKLYIEAKDDIYPLTIKIFETDAPPLYLGAGGKPAVLGLADQVGEIALPAHPNVLGAGDCRQTNMWHPNLDSNSATASNLKNPADIFNYVAIKQDQRSLTQFLPDSVHAPGTIEYRGVLRYDGIGGGEIHFKAPTFGADLTDPLRPIRSDCPKELYVRMYVKFESSFVSGDSDQFGFKMGVGFDSRFGIWDDGDQMWSNAVGSGQSDSYGCKSKWWPYRSTRDPLLEGAQNGDVWNKYDTGGTFNLVNGAWVSSGRWTNATNNSTRDQARWLYQGHSLRAHSGSFMGTTNTKYPNLISLWNAPSHLGLNPPGGFTSAAKGTYDTKWEGGVFGTEQVLKIGSGVHNKQGHQLEIEKWYCIEAYLKMNTIDLTNADHYGNGRANNDGILRYWIDGAMVGERTNLAFRVTPDLGVEGMFFIMYHGGAVNPAYIDPVTGLYQQYPDANMFYRLNNFACSTQYIGPNPVRNYPSTVDEPSDPPVTDGSLTAFAAAIGLSASPTNRWIDTNIKPAGAWAERSMVDGARYATQAEVEPGPADVGNYTGKADDTLVNSNGAAWFPTKKQFYWFGGGHGGWPGNEVYWMDIPSRTWGRLTNPSPMARWPEGPSGWGWQTLDNTPISYHTYNGIVAVESQDAFYTLFGSPWPDGNFPNSDLWKFHIPTKTWTKMLTNVFRPTVDEFRGPEAHWVPSMQKIAIGQPNYWRWYDPFTNALGPMLGSTSTMSNGNSVSTPTGIFCFGNNGVCTYIAHNQIGISRPTTISATTHPRIVNHPRFRDAAFPWNSYFWDATRNMIISWSASYNSEVTTGRVNVGKFVYGLDFANDHLYEFVVTGGTFSTSESLGSYTKWQHLTSLDCYIGLNNRAINNGWMVFKPGAPTLLA